MEVSVCLVTGGVIISFGHLVKVVSAKRKLLVFFTIINKKIYWEEIL